MCSVFILMTANSERKRTGKLILLLAIAQVAIICWQVRPLWNFSLFFLSNYISCEKQTFCYPGEICNCTDVNHDQNTLNNNSLESPKCRDHYCDQSACKALTEIHANEAQFYTTSWESWQGKEHLQSP